MSVTVPAHCQIQRQVVIHTLIRLEKSSENVPSSCSLICDGPVLVLYQQLMNGSIDAFECRLYRHSEHNRLFCYDKHLGRAEIRSSSLSHACKQCRGECFASCAKRTFLLSCALAAWSHVFVSECSAREIILGKDKLFRQPVVQLRAGAQIHFFLLVMVLPTSRNWWLHRGLSSE